MKIFTFVSFPRDTVCEDAGILREPLCIENRVSDYDFCFAQRVAIHCGLYQRCRESGAVDVAEVSTAI